MKFRSVGYEVRMSFKNLSPGLLNGQFAHELGTAAFAFDKAAANDGQAWQQGDASSHAAAHDEVSQLPGNKVMQLVIQTS